MNVPVPTLPGMPHAGIRAALAGMNLRGMGVTTAVTQIEKVSPPPVPPPPGFGAQFLDGLKAWALPLTAIKYLPQTLNATVISQTPGAVLGLWTPPLVLVILAITLTSSRKR